MGQSFFRVCFTLESHSAIITDLSSLGTNRPSRLVVPVELARRQPSLKAVAEISSNQYYAKPLEVDREQ